MIIYTYRYSIYSMSTLSILKKVQKTAYHGSKMASGLKGKIKNFQLWQILYAVLEYYTFKLSDLPSSS